jgi:hypothetical protein
LDQRGVDAEASGTRLDHCGLGIVGLTARSDGDFVVVGGTGAWRNTWRNQEQPDNRDQTEKKAETTNPCYTASHRKFTRLG